MPTNLTHFSEMPIAAQVHDSFAALQKTISIYSAEKREELLRSHVGRFGDNAEIRQGFQDVLTDPGLVLFHNDLSRMMAYMPKKPAGLFVSGHLAAYDKAIIGARPDRKHAFWRYDRH